MDTTALGIFCTVAGITMGWIASAIAGLRGDARVRALYEKQSEQAADDTHSLRRRAENAEAQMRCLRSALEEVSHHATTVPTEADIA
jgi:hypothetical protein